MSADEILTESQTTNEINHECNICYKDLTEKMVCTPCNHYYCTGCFFKWMNESSTCPNCRKILASQPETDTLLVEREELLNTLNDNIASQFNLFRFLRRDTGKIDRENRKISMRKHELEYMVSKKKMELEDLNAEKKQLKRSLKSMINYRRDWSDIESNRDNHSREYVDNSIERIERSMARFLNEEDE